MKEITILSGKGGTGKTSVTAALASVASQAVFCDNDVDAADLHLIFLPENTEEHRFFSGYKALIDPERCRQCGICEDHCRFDAIHLNASGRLEINPFQCEGCRLCERVCPYEAIRSVRHDHNFWYVANTRFGPLVHARMGPGEENSGKLVSQVRRRARELAQESGAEWIINDGPPGIGCAAIASLSGTDLVLMVIEPSRSGLHDARRLLELCQSFSKLKVVALINKYDLNSQLSHEIETFLEENHVPLLARLPFDSEVVAAMAASESMVEHHPDAAFSASIKKLWSVISESF